MSKPCLNMMDTLEDNGLKFPDDTAHSIAGDNVIRAKAGLTCMTVNLNK